MFKIKTKYEKYWTKRDVFEVDEQKNSKAYFIKDGFRVFLVSLKLKNSQRVIESKNDGQV